MFRLAAGVWLTLTISTFAAEPKRLLLVGQGPDGHPKQTHEYRAGVRIIEKLLKPVKEIEMTIVSADGPWKEGPDLLERTDAVVFFVSEGARWMVQDAKRLLAMQKLAKRGGGIIVLHWGMGTKDAVNIEPFVTLAGACHGGPDRKYQVLETTLTPANMNHPILNGIGELKVKEEFYYALKTVKSDKPITPLFYAMIDGQKQMVGWAWERPDGGRSFGFSGLHFHDNWKYPEYRRLVTQATLWTLKLSVPDKGFPVDIAEADLLVK